jgi:hypothetical protein
VQIVASEVLAKLLNVIGKHSWVLNGMINVGVQLGLSISAVDLDIFCCGYVEKIHEE